MRKIILLIAMFITCAFCASESEEFFYQRGFEAGYNKGFKQGAEKGLNEGKEVIKKYKAEIDAYEIGKYLVKSQRLTYPQVWQQRVGNELKLVILPAEIKEQLDVEALFNRFATIPTLPENILGEIDLTNQNSVYLANRDRAVDGIPSVAGREKDIITVNVAKTWKNEDILKKSNLVYSEGNNAYKVIFFSQKEKSDFCKNFGICK